MSESDLYQVEGLEEDMEKLRAMRTDIFKLWLDLSDFDFGEPGIFHTALAKDAHHQALEMLKAATEHIQLLTGAQAWAADPSTDTGVIEVTMQ